MCAYSTSKIFRTDPFLPLVPVGHNSPFALCPQVAGFDDSKPSRRHATMDQHPHPERPIATRRMAAKFLSKGNPALGVAIHMRFLGTTPVARFDPSATAVAVWHSANS